MNGSQKTVYITPNKPSELMPLLGEALLLYDKVALDLSTRSSIDVLASNVSGETMELLFNEGIVIPVYDSFAPIIATQSKEDPNRVFLLNFESNGIPSIDFEYMKEIFTPIFPKNIVDVIEQRSIPCNVNRELLLDNINLDFSNQELMIDIFSYVKEQFELPEFDIEFGNNGCFFVPHTKNKTLANRIIEEASYGLHLLADLNYKSALLAQFDEVICESEMENFFVSKLRQSYKTIHYKQQSENLMELCEIYDFPDIKESVAAGILKLEVILNLRKKEGRLLRTWLNKTTVDCINTKVPFSKELSKLLVQSNGGMTLPTRTVIFGCLQLLSFIKPVEAVMMSAANEYLVPQLMKKWQPKYFFDKARKMQIKRKYRNV